MPTGIWMLLIGAILIVMSSIFLMQQVYRLILLDAASRGVPKPKVWAVFSAAGGRGEGLLLYFFKRKKYLGTMTAQERIQAEKLKLRILLLMVMTLLAFIFIAISLFFYL